jgi:hypothetical protein
MQFQPNDLTERTYFGFSVAMDDDIAVVGTLSANANSAYVFAPVLGSSSVPTSSWTQMAKLTGSTTSYFGSSVAVSGNCIVVGASWDDNTNGMDAGAVLVFTKTTVSSSSSSTTWTQMARLLAADGAAFDFFGAAVSIAKGTSTIVVGADWHDFNTTVVDSGAAYLFRMTNSTTTMVEWTQVGKILEADPVTMEYLGRSVVIDDNIVVVGASGDNSRRGSVYILETGFSSSTPPMMTTTPPTVAIATPQPMSSPSPNPIMPFTTMAPRTLDNHNSTALLPMTNSPTSTILIPPTTIPPSLIGSNKDLTDSPINSIPTMQTPVAEQPNADSGTHESGFIPGVHIVGILAGFIVSGWLPWNEGF